MIRTYLDDTIRDELQVLRRQQLPPRVRDRIEMVTPLRRRLVAPSDRQTPRLLRPDRPRYAPRLSRPWPRGPLPVPIRPAPDVAHLDRVAEELRRLLAEDRTWTSRQLSQALAERGIRLGARQVRRHLKRIQAGYRRTASSLKHKQDPVKAARAGRILDNLKAKAIAGDLILYYLDECGFSPTLPVGYSWSLPKQRKFIRYEAPQGRRVNALGAYRPFGASPRLDIFTAERTWDSYDLLGFLKALPWSKRPRVVVLDNASFHTKYGDQARSPVVGRDGDRSVLPAAV